MKMRVVDSPKVKTPPPGTWSNCKVYGNQVYISGMTGRDLSGNVAGDGSVYAQSQCALERIKHLIEAAGGTMNDIIKITVYVTDIKQREQFWRARKEFFTGAFPCSTLVEVRALDSPNILVEVEAVGFIGASA
jgi:enamine deaminase RidA (YjgF/YER057c/UK114 family)